MAGSAKMTGLVAALARLVLGGVFIYAGVGKVLDPAAFAGDIANYRLLPHPAAAALAAYLPWLEILAGLAVFRPRLRPGALFVLGGLSLVFAAAIASALARGLDISCGCFGHGRASGALLGLSLLRALVLAGMAAVLLARDGGGAGSGAGAVQPRN